MRRGNRDAAVTAKWKARFIEEMLVFPNVSKACEVAGVGRTTAYAHLKRDNDFAEAVDDAEQKFADTLEQYCAQRATTGYLRPVYQQGKLVGHVREFSDSIAIVMLKGLKREKYGDKIEQTIRAKPMSPEEIERLSKLAEDGVLSTIMASLGHAPPKQECLPKPG